MWSYIKNSLLLNGILFILVFILGYSAWSMVRQTIFLSDEARELERKKEELIRKKEYLEERLAELEIKDTIEREAKERLNLKQPGERVVVVVPEKKGEPKENKEQNMWSRMRQFFIDLLL